MERNTKTTIGELQPGDRFYFIGDAKRISYQLMLHKGKYGEYNVIYDNGVIAWKYNKTSSHIKQVMFLRHTIN